MLSFKYTKKDGSVSERHLSVEISPNTMYEGVDISELDETQRAAYCAARIKMREEYLKSIGDLNELFDVNFRYRRFDPKLMSSIKHD